MSAAEQHTQPGSKSSVFDEQPPARKNATLAPWQALRIKAHLEAQFDRALHVSELAQLVRLSPRYFSAAFRGTFGQPPYMYLLQHRVRRACELMLTTVEPLSQIALSCGFADQAHLTHVFRARIGLSPNAWRRSRGDAGGWGLANLDAAALRRRTAQPDSRPPL